MFVCSFILFYFGSVSWGRTDIYQAQLPPIGAFITTCFFLLFIVFFLQIATGEAYVDGHRRRPESFGESVLYRTSSSAVVLAWLIPCLRDVQCIGRSPTEHCFWFRLAFYLLSLTGNDIWFPVIHLYSKIRLRTVTSRPVQLEHALFLYCRDTIKGIVITACKMIVWNPYARLFAISGILDRMEVLSFSANNIPENSELPRGFFKHIKCHERQRLVGQQPFRLKARGSDGEKLTVLVSLPFSMKWACLTSHRRCLPPFPSSPYLSSYLRNAEKKLKALVVQVGRPQ